MELPILGGSLRRLRKASGKSIDDIAKHMGWSKSYLMSIELGFLVPPEIEELYKLATYLEIDKYGTK